MKQRGKTIQLMTKVQTVTPLYKVCANYYYMFQKYHPLRNQLILIIFGIQHPEDQDVVNLP